MLQPTCRLSEHFQPARPQPGHSTHICNIEAKDFQTFREEMDFAARETATFQILPSVWSPCSLMLHCEVSRHQAHLLTCIKKV